MQLLLLHLHILRVVRVPLMALSSLVTMFAGPAWRRRVLSCARSGNLGKGSFSMSFPFGSEPLRTRRGRVQYANAYKTRVCLHPFIKYNHIKQECCELETQCINCDCDSMRGVLYMFCVHAMDHNIWLCRTPTGS